MLGMDQYKNYWKDREQIFKDNVSKFPDLEDIWQLDKEKAINGIVGLNSFKTAFLC